MPMVGMGMAEVTARAEAGVRDSRTMAKTPASVSARAPCMR